MLRATPWRYWRADGQTCAGLKDVQQGPKSSAATPSPESAVQPLYWMMLRD